MVEPSAVEAALASLRPGMEADGFELRVGALSADGRVCVILEAQPGACLECLVPEHLLIAILEDAIREQGATLDRLELVKVGFA